MKRTLFAALAMLVAPAAALADDVPEALLGRWLAEDINGGGVIDRLQTTLEIDAGGRFSGSGGCNRYGGTLTVEGEGLSFGPAAATRMACAPAAMDQETKFFGALDGVTGFAVEEATGRLTLLGPGERPLVTLTRLADNADLTITVPGAERIERHEVRYRCGEEAVTAEYINAGPVSLVTLTRGDDFTVAANVIAASGAKYAGGSLVWWTEGETATLYDVTAGEDAPGVECLPEA